MTDANRDAAVAAGELLLAALRTHLDRVRSGDDESDAAVEIDRRLWEAVGEYGEALDLLYDEHDAAAEEPDEDAAQELTFTVRTRYDYTVVDEKQFLSAGQGVGHAVNALIQKAGRPLAALEVPSLETGSGLLTVHLNDEPLEAGDFDTADEPADLLLVAPNEALSLVIDEPVYASRAEAEAAAKKD